MKTYYLESAPPSLNNAFPTGKNGRRYKSKRYSDWFDGAMWLLKKQGIVKIDGPYGLEITIGRHLSKADIDNLIKPISDVLNKVGVTDDDSKMETVTITRATRPDIRIVIFKVDLA